MPDATDGIDLVALAKAARQTEERARKIAEAAEAGNLREFKWESMMGALSFGGVDNEVEKQVRSRMVDLKAWERQERGLRIFLDWINLLSEEDRQAVLISVQRSEY